MALTYAALGTVDPSRQEIDATSPPNDLKMKLVDVTIGSTSDYSSGLAITASSVGFTAIIGAMGMSLRQSGGTARAMLGVWNVSTGKFQIYQGDNLTGSSDGPFVEITGAALAASDVARIALIGL